MRKYGLTTFSGPPRRALAWLARVIRDRQVLALLGILALGAYLRLWNIHHLFNAIHDYDEGVYSLGARFISQGYLPYQDFTLTHPPLYNFALASVYKVFGYSFFYGKYLSVALSLACIILIYFIGRKMYHPGAGLMAAALVAVSPEMVYFGRRSVQESLGIFLILIAVYIAFNFRTSQKGRRFLLCGLFLGLAAATKYIFIPALAAVIVATALLSMEERYWRSIKSLGNLWFWVVYACIAGIFFALLLLFKWVLNLDISIPFLDPMYPTPGNVATAILLFVLPLLVTLVVVGKRFPVKEWCGALWELRLKKELWLLLAGTVLGFILITGFFWIKAPQDFIYQTLLMQQNRPYLEFPSLAAVIRTAPNSLAFLKLAFLPILLSIPLILVLLNKRSFSKGDCFLSVSMIVSLLLCQGFYHLPRYYISLYPFLLLGLSGLMPPVDVKVLTTRLRSLALRIKASLLVPLASTLLFLSLSIVLLTNYTGYDINWPWFASNEEYIYSETIDYLEGVGAKKVYAVNPIFVAMTPNLDSTLAVDSFALLWLEETPSEEIIQHRIAEGVDYVVLDSWVRYWSYPYDEQARELTMAIRDHSRLVKVIAPDSMNSVEIYRLGAEAEGIFNGNFEHWARTGEMAVPLGWNPTLIKSEGDEAIIREADIDGKECVALDVYEDGERHDETDSTHAGISQKISFPQSKIVVEVFPRVNTTTAETLALGPCIHFIDCEGHSCIIGFSDEVNTETIIRSEDGKRMLAFQPAQLNQWSEHSIDLPAYWSHAGWQQPTEVTVLLVVSAYYTNPGYYSFYVADIEMEGT